MRTGSSGSPVYERPAELLQHLIRFDTTNPPGNETDCVAFIEGLLIEAGFETVVVGHDPQRPNLVTRLRGSGDSPAFLMHGHVDVVTAAHQDWQHPPFGGDIVDGYVWGRGALDMKGAVAIMLAALLRAKAEGLHPPGDVVLAVTSDEETGGDFGARYLVENHPELFQGVRYAISEGGGQSVEIEGREFYPIKVAEKQVCWMKAVLRGPGGHGSSPRRGGAMARLGKVLTTLDSRRLPVHVTASTRAMAEGMAAVLPAPFSSQLREVLDPARTDALLDRLGLAGEMLDPLLHNTVSPTIVRGGEKVNVIPSEITLELDGRLLPGYRPEDMLSELHTLLGDDLEIEVTRADPYPSETDMGLYDTLAGLMREADPEGVPIPSVLTGFTDGHHFDKLGIQTYGFVPMSMPAGVNLRRTVHGADERVPVEAIGFGADVLYKLLGRLGG